MAGQYKLFVIRLFVVLNVLTAIVFLLACLAPYSNPGQLVGAVAIGPGLWYYLYYTGAFCFLLGHCKTPFYFTVAGAAADWL